MATEFIYDTPLWKVRRLGDGWYQGETPLWESPTERTRDFEEARRLIEDQVERYLDAAKAGGDLVPPSTAEHFVTCPDGGRCWHECRRRCWRVHNTVPLSDYGADDWPLDIDDTPRRPGAGVDRAERSDVGSGVRLYDLQATGAELGAVHRLLAVQIEVLETWASMRHTTEEEAKALRHDAGLVRSFVKRNYEEVV